MKTRPGLFAALACLISALACVLPGTQQPVAPIKPTADTRLEHMVAETVSAALELTANAVPTATSTLPPPTVTATSQPSLTGSILTLQPDGSTLFVDENGGYQISVPMGWLPVRVNEKEYYDAWSLPAAADSHIQAALQAVQKQDPQTFRLLVLDIQEGHIQNELVTNVNLIWDPSLTLSFDSEEDLQKVADNLPSIVPGLTVSSVEIAVPADGAMPFGLIKSKIDGVNSSSAPVTLYQEQAYFNLKEGTLAISFTTESGFIETAEPVFGEMLKSISFVTQ